jgi:hypothetical protein
MAESEVRWENNKIVCLLFVTLPTSKVRVKRNDSPLAVRQTTLRDDDLLEWQISYYKEGKVLIEVEKMLELAYRHNILTKEELKKLKVYAQNVPELFAEKTEICKERTDKKFLKEFEIIFRRVPIIRKELRNNCFVEAELKHKQRAVGYQPMLYIFIPVENVLSNKGVLSGRRAEAKEFVRWYPTKDDIEGTIKTFAVLSKTHNSDIIEIIDTILSK